MDADAIPESDDVVPVVDAYPIGNVETYPVVIVALESLRPHPRNYKTHPPDQIEHLMASLVANGFYRAVVVANDDTILAGHGICQAAERLGMTHVPIMRLPVDSDSPEALRVMTSDNELPKFAETDDRLLTELLRDVADTDGGLTGTGFDEMMLANLVMVTRPTTEVPDLNHAAEWAGLPSMGQDAEPPCKIVINFTTQEDLRRFEAESRLPDLVRYTKVGANGKFKSGWWPDRGQFNDPNLEWIMDDDA